MMSETHFNLYVAALAISGFLLVGMALSGFGGIRTAARVINGLFGVGFLGYAFYLFFIFDGGVVHEFYYAFLVPVIVIYRAFKARSAAGGARA
jgi:hypothetical protein